MKILLTAYAQVRRGMQNRDRSYDPICTMNLLTGWHGRITFRIQRGNGER
jgi:hypothetical protein